jgi:hypothetical protein
LSSENVEGAGYHYSYVGNDPLDHTDPTGEAADALGNFYPAEDDEDSGGIRYNPYLVAGAVLALPIAATACVAGDCEAVAGGGVVTAIKVAIGRALGETGSIYRVPGSATKSGKPYIGRHNKPKPQETRKSNDGRDRTKAKVTDTYDTENPAKGRLKEQRGLDKEGDVDKTDNKRNEIAPKNVPKVEDEAKQIDSGR